jgi:hypothetical protein
MAGSKSVFASPLEKIQPNGANHAGDPETPGGQAFKGLDILSLSNLMRQENASGSPSLSWGEILTNPISRLGLSTRETAFVEPTTADQHVPGYGKGLSSSSLSEVFSGKCEFPLPSFFPLQAMLIVEFYHLSCTTTKSTVFERNHNIVH